MFTVNGESSTVFGRRQMHLRCELLRGWVPVDLRRLTFELSGGEAVRLNEGLGVTAGGKARYGLNATDPAAARRGALKTALTFTERQRP